MKHNKAAGPDYLPIEFYQVFWDKIKHDLKALFDAFHARKLGIERLNHEIIALIPKVPDADVIQNFRPICLLNVSYKILTKLLPNRLGLVIGRVVSETQTAFINNRYILEGVVILHAFMKSFIQSNLAYCSRLILKKHMIRSSCMFFTRC